MGYLIIVSAVLIVVLALLVFVRSLLRQSNELVHTFRDTQSPARDVSNNVKRAKSNEPGRMMPADEPNATKITNAKKQQEKTAKK
ncbi:MAG: hypothetical protein ACOCXV_00585 [Bacteroidota bacterium]